MAKFMGAQASVFALVFGFVVKTLEKVRNEKWCFAENRYEGRV
jgi:hypothetical protein